MRVIEKKRLSGDAERNTTFNNGSLGFRIDEERRESAKRNVNCRIQ
jgi:hypothetical protein